MKSEPKIPLPRQQVFYVTSNTTRINGHNFIYIEADRWFDARELACTIYGPNEFGIENQTKNLEVFRHKYSLHRGNWWLLTWVGNAASNTLHRVVWHYLEEGRRECWVDSSSVTRTHAPAAGE